MKAKIAQSKKTEEELSLSLRSTEERLEVSETQLTRVQGSLDDCEMLAEATEERRMLAEHNFEDIQTELRDTKNELEDAEDRLENVQAELENVQAELDDLETNRFERVRALERSLGVVQESMDDKTRHLIDNFDALLRVFNRTSTCQSRDCEAKISLNCYITRSEQDVHPYAPQYNLRCGFCKCRQV